MTKGEKRLLPELEAGGASRARTQGKFYREKTSQSVMRTHWVIDLLSQNKETETKFSEFSFQKALISADVSFVVTDFISSRFPNTSVPHQRAG